MNAPCVCCLKTVLNDASGDDGTGRAGRGALTPERPKSRVVARRTQPVPKVSVINDANDAAARCRKFTRLTLREVRIVVRHRPRFVCRRENPKAIRGRFVRTIPATSAGMAQAGDTCV